jgi:hypothetical protein
MQTASKRHKPNDVSLPKPNDVSLPKPNDVSLPEECKKHLDNIPHGKSPHGVAFCACCGGIIYKKPLRPQQPNGFPDELIL